MAWSVELDSTFEKEVEAFSYAVRIEILTLSRLLQQFGPQLARPHCDTLKGSEYTNMKELRFAFAFDHRRQAILLVGGSKSGINEKRFYRDLIRTADARFNAHLEKLRKEAEEKKS